MKAQGRTANLAELLEMAMDSDEEAPMSIVLPAGLLARMITAFSLQENGSPPASQTMQ